MALGLKKMTNCMQCMGDERRPQVLLGIIEHVSLVVMSKSMLEFTSCIHSLYVLLELNT